MGGVIVCESAHDGSILYRHGSLAISLKKNRQLLISEPNSKKVEQEAAVGFFEFLLRDKRRAKEVNRPSPTVRAGKQNNGTVAPDKSLASIKHIRRRQFYPLVYDFAFVLLFRILPFRSLTSST